MHIAEATRSVNGQSTNYPHAAAGHNGMTRLQWLDRILHSGQVTRVGQHLALVIFHLSDRDNVARLSMRELERITGWSRQTIHDHLCEIELFIRFEAGKGRRKTTFEMQGVIAEAVKTLRPADVMASQIDATADAKIDANVVAKEVDAKIDATADANLVASQIDAKIDTKAASNAVVANQIDTTANEGGTIGGEQDKTPTFHNDCFSLSGGAPENLRAWTLDADGSFGGQVFEIEGSVYAALQLSYADLEFPAELIAADQFLAEEFVRDGTTEPNARFARLHTYLAKQNRKAASHRRAAEAVYAAKSANSDDSCRLDGDRLVVANGFRSDLLALVGGNASRLDRTLAKIGGKIPARLKGDDMRRLVKAEFVKQVDYDERDERKVNAIVNRGAPVAYKPKQASQRPINYDPAEDPAMQEFAKSMLE